MKEREMIMSNNGGAGVEDEGARSKGMGMGMGMVVKKGPWSASEDAVLIDYVKKHGEGNWNAVQRNTGLQRCGKSCRLRWANHLRPNLKKGAFTSIEERLIIDLHSKLGNKWARISAHLPGRTDNEIKNYWNTRVKRRIRQGLPLYPNDQQTPSSPPPQLHPPTLPLSLPKTPPPTLSLFNQISLSSPVFSLHHHHPPPPLHHLSPHSLKNCSQNSYLSSPIFPPTQVGPIQMNPMGLGFEPGRRPELDGFGFGNPSYEELPSNQYNQSNNIYGSNNNNGGNNYGEVENEVVKMDPNVGRANSGLLGDLLQEAHIMVGNKKESQEDDVAFQWDVSSSENSSTGLKKQECEEEQVNMDGEDIKNILEMIPSLVEAPGWCDDGCAESSAAQSSAVSTNDNYNNNINVFDDHQMPQPPSFGDDDDDGGGDWNPESYYWDDNFPKFC